MKLRAEQLSQDLGRGLKPCYLVSGDEPLLAGEAADLIRKSARQQDYLERQLFHADSTDWDAFLNESQSLSLFADRRILEVRIANGKPGDRGSKALVQYCENPAPDTLLLVISSKLDRSQQRSKWVTALEKIGAHIQIWPVDLRQMPGWLNQRLRSKGITADRDAVTVLAQRVEGNLLAAQQEIEKLALSYSGQAIDAKTMTELVTQNSRYDAFTLVDRCLAGQGLDALRTLEGLGEEGTDAIQVLWALTREVRQLLEIRQATDKGASLEASIAKAGVWQKRQPLVHKAARRSTLQELEDMLKLCRLCDESVKGGGGHPWLQLKTLVMALSGQPAIPVSTELLAARRY